MLSFIIFIMGFVAGISSTYALYKLVEKYDW